MVEILVVVLTHSPSLISPDEDRNTSLHRTLKNNDITYISNSSKCLAIAKA